MKRLLLIAALALATGAHAAEPACGPAPVGKALPRPDQTVSTIAFGSDLADKPKPILGAIAAQKPDLFVLLGDAVFAKTDDLDGLCAAYAELARDREFTAFRAATPMVVTWDDHDYGANDGGGEFAQKGPSQRMFDRFWRLVARRHGRAGVYDAYSFGPKGRRVQVLLLDTRSGRSLLTHMPKSDETGRYLPSADPDQRMLSDAQWRWLEAQLRQPADVRIIVSSIQVLADGHHWEAWSALPREQQHLYAAIKRSGARGVVLVSGDRVLGAVYRRDDLLDYPAYELTTSSLNLAWHDVSGLDTPTEISTGQIGAMFPDPNFGRIDIDWKSRRLSLSLEDRSGQTVRRQDIALDALRPGQR